MLICFFVVVVVVAILEKEEINMKELLAFHLKTSLEPYTGISILI